MKPHTTYTINTAQDITGVAPKGCRWSAWFGDADIHTVCGHGETETDAVEDLLNNYDTPWGAA